MKNDILTLLTCSAVMTGVSLLFLVLRRLAGPAYSARWRRITWLVLLAGFLIPYRPRTAAPLITAALPASPTSAAFHPERGLFLIWVLGAAVALSLRLVQHAQFLQSVRRLSFPVPQECTHQLFQQVCMEMGIDRRIRLSQVSGLASPMLVGLRKPWILLPEQTFSARELALIFRHELIHFQRKDLWYQCLLELAHAIHWFNPFFLPLKKIIRADLECACDERVTFYASKEERAIYCRAILQVIRQKSSLQSTLSTSFGHGPGELKQRFEEIFSEKKKRAFLGIALLILLLTAGSSQLFALTQDENGRADNDFRETETTYIAGEESGTGGGPAAATSDAPDGEVSDRTGAAFAFPPASPEAAGESWQQGDGEESFTTVYGSD